VAGVENGIPLSRTNGEGKRGKKLLRIGTSYLELPELPEESSLSD
jgi:hypothetical protein